MFYVYYSDGHADNGDVGINACETETEALAFILHRLNSPDGGGRKLDNYILIEGKKLKVETKQTVTALQVKR